MNNSAKILLLGKTGVGKSAFINYFLGKEVAKSAAGKPVTMKYFIPYEIAEGRYPIEIFDTKGLETLNANNQLDEIIQGIKKRNNSDDIFNWFHTIFYCVSMAIPRFEPLEAKFIRRLQKELSQHIHIIITHCDTCTEEKIADMRRKIVEELGNMENIEIFEVVCVSMKKRTGKVTEPYGKEKISERVFDLLLKDVAYKLSFDYAKTLWNALNQVVSNLCLKLDVFIDEIVKVGTIISLVKDADKMSERFDDRMDEVFMQLEEETGIIQKQTDERFMKILRPVAQLYSSYRGVVTDSYVEHTELAFSDTLEWLDTGWMEKVDEKKLMAKVFPHIGKYMNENGDLLYGNSIFEIFDMIGAGVGDLFSLKKNLKKATQELYSTLVYQTIPSQDEIQAKAYERIVKYIKPDALFE